jgi:hypothetical protein
MAGVTWKKPSASTEEQWTVSLDVLRNPSATESKPSKPQKPSPSPKEPPEPPEGQ